MICSLDPNVQPKPPQKVFEYDIRKAELGVLLGEGKLVVNCPKCHQPGIHHRYVRCKDGFHSRMAHRLEYWQSPGGDLKLIYSDCCTSHLVHHALNP